MDVTENMYSDVYHIFLNIGLLFVPILFIYNLKIVSKMLTRKRYRVNYNSDILEDTSDTESTSDISDTYISDDDSDISERTITLNDVDNNVYVVDEQVQMNKRNVNEEILRRGMESSYDVSLNELHEKIRHILSDL